MAIACSFAGLCYAELASMIPIAGSAYTYSYATLGEIFAWIIGWDLILEYVVSNVVVAIGFSAYTKSQFGLVRRELARPMVYSCLGDRALDGFLFQFPGVSNCFHLDGIAGARRSRISSKPTTLWSLSRSGPFSFFWWLAERW